MSMTLVWVKVAEGASRCDPDLILSYFTRDMVREGLRQACRGNQGQSGLHIPRRPLKRRRAGPTGTAPAWTQPGGPS